MTAFLSLSGGVRDRPFLLRIPAEGGRFHETPCDLPELRAFALLQYKIQADPTWKKHWMIAEAVEECRSTIHTND